MNKTHRKHSGTSRRKTIQSQLRRAVMTPDERKERKQELRRSLGFAR